MIMYFTINRSENFEVTNSIASWYLSGKRWMTSYGSNDFVRSAKQYNLTWFRIWNRKRDLEAILPFPMSHSVRYLPYNHTYLGFVSREWINVSELLRVNEWSKERLLLFWQDFCNVDVKKRTLWKVGTQYWKKCEFLWDSILASGAHSYRQLYFKK